IKPSTRHYWNQIFVALLKSWPGLADLEIRRITKTDCKKWARGFRKVASPTRYNNTFSGLRHVFDVAKDDGVTYSNPAGHLERLLGQSAGGFGGSFFAPSVSDDAKHPDVCALYLRQSGLCLVDCDYYFDAKFQPQVDRYREYVAQMLTLAGWPSPGDAAAKVV